MSAKSRMIGFVLTETSIGDPVVYAVNENRQKIGRMVMTVSNPLIPQRPNLIKIIAVLPEYQRQGIATAMWNFAKEKGLRPAHDLEKTEDGEASAKAIGD